MIKDILKKMINPSARRRVRYLLGWKKFDETDIVYQTIKDTDKPKVMIDVGACTGASLEKFAKDGWCVYAFEPDSNNRAELIRLSNCFPSFTIDCRAVSNKNEKQCLFYTSSVSAGISGLSSFHPSHKESMRVDTVTLETFCGEKNVTAINFLKIDAEGFDFFVLQKVPWDSVRPEVILCEFEDRKTVPLGYTFHDMAAFLVDKAYHLLISEWYPIVEYGRRHRWRRFTSYPCELLDKNAFGNIFAVDNKEIHKKLCSQAEIYGKQFV